MGILPNYITDKGWDMVSSLFKNGNRSNYDKHILMEAILYITKTGYQWRNLPDKYPPWGTVYMFFSRLKKTSLLEKINSILLSELSNRKKKFRYFLIDSQTIRTVFWHPCSQIDGGKRMKGIKRQIITNNDGNIVACAIQPGNLHDTKGGSDLLLSMPYIAAGSIFYADNGYKKIMLTVSHNKVDKNLICW
jgi:transposase